MLGKIRDLIGRAVFPLVRGSSSVVRRSDLIVRYNHPTLFVRVLHLLAFGRWRHPYEDNDYLELAQYRRRIASLILEFEMRQADLVAPILYIEKNRNRGFGIVCPFIEGETPEPGREARLFLDRVTGIFRQVGLPTWQVNARVNPRAWTNVIWSPDRTRLTIIDLESQIVSPFVPLPEWWAAWCNDHPVPFDEMDFTRLRTYGRASGSAYLCNLIQRAQQLHIEICRREERIWSPALDF